MSNEHVLHHILVNLSFISWFTHFCRWNQRNFPQNILDWGTDSANFLAFWMYVSKSCSSDHKSENIFWIMTQNGGLPYSSPTCNLRVETPVVWHVQISHCFSELCWCWGWKSIEDSECPLSNIWPTQFEKRCLPLLEIASPPSSSNVYSGPHI